MRTQYNKLKHYIKSRMCKSKYWIIRDKDGKVVERITSIKPRTYSSMQRLFAQRYKTKISLRHN